MQERENYIHTLSMYPEYPTFLDGLNYVVENKEPVEREVKPLEERIKDPNHWQGTDWHYYYLGKRDGDLGLTQRCANPFYLLGYDKAQEKYQKKHN